MAYSIGHNPRASTMNTWGRTVYVSWKRGKLKVAGKCDEGCPKPRILVKWEK